MGLRDKLMSFFKKLTTRRLITSTEDIENIKNELNTNDFSVEGGNVNTNKDKDQEQDQSNARQDDLFNIDTDSLTYIQTYKTLSATVSKDLDEKAAKFNSLFFANKQIKEVDGKQGTIGPNDKPFKCYLILGEDGSVEMTEIVTNDSFMTIKEDEDGNKDFTEVQEKEDGYHEINIKEEYGQKMVGHHVLPKNFNPATKQKFEKFKEKYNSPKAINEISNKFVPENGQDNYKKLLDDLGVRDHHLIENKSELKQAQEKNTDLHMALVSTNATGTLDNRTGEFKISTLGYLYDENEVKENGKPDKVWIISENKEKDQKPDIKVFRKTKDGQYLDESSMQFDKDGNIVDYSLVGLDQIEKMASEKNLRTMTNERLAQYVAEQKEAIPKEVLAIKNDVQKQIESPNKQQIDIGKDNNGLNNNGMQNEQKKNDRDDEER